MAPAVQPAVFTGVAAAVVDDTIEPGVLSAPGRWHMRLRPFLGEGAEEVSSPLHPKRSKQIRWLKKWELELEPPIRKILPSQNHKHPQESG